MVKVIKLDESEEKFSEKKLKVSITKAMDAVGNVNDSLAENVLTEVKSFIRGKEYVLTKDLRNEVIKLLATKESSEVAKAYMMFVKESQSQRINHKISKIYSPNPSDCGT